MLSATGDQDEKLTTATAATVARKNAMRIVQYLAGAALALLAVSLQAQARFQISDLHPDLVFADAVAAIEKLGGRCRIKQSQTEGGGVSAQCALAPAGGSAGTVAAEEPAVPASGPMIGPQPITRIGVEAPLASVKLTRIVFEFDGGLESVAQYLVQQYGKPDHDGTLTADLSWSHSKRRIWSDGNYTMGLLNSPNLVILTVNRPSPDPGAS
jgi:hypothetical protein